MAFKKWLLRFCKPSLRCSLAVSIIVFLIFLSTAYVLSTIYGQYVKNNSLEAVKKGLWSDLEHLRIQGDAIAQNDTLKELIVSGDQGAILSFIAEERERRGIGLMGVTDKDGIIISRTLTTGNRGENALLISPQGRALSSGRKPASIEVSSFDPVQVLMTTGRFVVNGTSTVGALFANYLLDDNYSSRFKSAHLPRGVEVLFYTKEHGIYGTSIKVESQRSILASYFNIDSDWIKNGRSGDIVRFDSGTYYRVENIVFPGLEHSSGGVLVFIPYYGYGLAIRSIIVFFTILIFLVLSYHVYRSTKREHRNRYYIWSAVSAFLMLLVIIYLVNHAVFSRYVSLKRVPYVLYNSTLRLQPESGVFDKDFERPISVLVDTGDEKINAVGVNISFDPDRVKIQEIDTENSICSNFLEKNVDMANKEIRIYCIMASPGFSGQHGVVADIIAKPIKVGVLSLAFSNSTQVLANDGLGTNVLRKSENGSYQVISSTGSATTSRSRADDTGEVGSPIVFSPTHSNGARWYNKRDVELFWTAVPGEGYVYAFDQATGTVPSMGDMTIDTRAKVTAPSDGIFYFHVAPVKGGVTGPVRHYKVMIDATPPNDVTVRASEDKVSMGDVVRFEFNGQDNMSGLQSTMYIDIDNDSFLPVGSQTYVPMVRIGSVPVRLRVYDRAGNYTEKEKIVRVSGTILQSILHGR